VRTIRGVLTHGTKFMGEARPPEETR